MLRVPNFSNIIPWGALIHKNYIAGCDNLQKLYCWVRYFYTKSFTLKDYWNCLRVNAGLKNKL